MISGQPWDVAVVHVGWRGVLGSMPPPIHVPRGIVVFREGWGEGHQFEDVGGADQEVL